MYKRIVLFFMFLGFAFGAFAQETDTTKVEEPAEVPVISYSSPPKKYKIADIKVTGIKNYDDFVLIAIDYLLEPFADKLKETAFDYKAFKEEQYDKLAAHVRKHVDLPLIYQILTDND